MNSKTLHLHICTNFVQAKKFVESTPQVVKKDISKEEAEKLKAALEAAGGVVEFE